MPEASLLNRPAVPTEAVENAARGWRLEAAAQGHVLQVLGAPGIADLVERARAVSDGGPFAVRPAGVSQIYIVGDSPLAPSAVRERAARLGEAGTLVDQSHGRVRLVLSGPGARAVLATATAVDLSDRAFPVGSAAETLFVHVSMHLTRVGPDRYELLVFRSFAQTVWDEIVH